MQNDNEKQPVNDQFAQLEREAAQLEPPQFEEVMPEPEVPTWELLRPIIDLGCDLLAPNWSVKDAERTHLCKAYGDVVDKYFPGGLSAFGCELNALLITAAIIGPRVAAQLPRREPEQKENDKKPD